MPTPFHGETNDDERKIANDAIVEAWNGIGNDAGRDCAILEGLRTSDIGLRKSSLPARKGKHRKAKGMETKMIRAAIAEICVAAALPSWAAGWCSS